MPTATGLSECDYPEIASLTSGLKHLNQIETMNKIPIPPEVMEHFKRMDSHLTQPNCNMVYYTLFSVSDIKCHCMMGLFPEIGRAWLTIDSDIYVNILIYNDFFVGFPFKYLLFILDLDVRTYKRCCLL